MRWIVLLLMCASLKALGQNMDGKVVIEFNAGFNTKNGYEDLSYLKGCRLYRIDIEKNPKLKTQYQIKSVPTLILFVDGDEKWRWEAGLDMRVRTDYFIIQQTIDRF
jgi:hypothetical protein